MITTEFEMARQIMQTEMSSWCRQSQCSTLGYCSVTRATLPFADRTVRTKPVKNEPRP